MGTASPDLRLATDNFAAFWSVLADARGHALVRRPGFLAVTGSDRTGLRVLLLTPEPSVADLANLIELVRSWLPGPVTVEDPFSTVELTGCGLAPMRMPIMVRPPEPVGRAHPASAPTSAPALAPALAPSSTPDPAALGDAAIDVHRVGHVHELTLVEDVVVHDFPLPPLQPYQMGEAFPPALLDRPEVGLHLARRGEVPAGACLTLTGPVTTGLYWMTTLPEHRSYGVGRSLLESVLAGLPERRMVLTATPAGRPLYDSLGFRAIAEATWWIRYV
ncbi:GNAT family N-acetyltransferase [Plantactinospora sp. GCM10030261]|uniref:GNAT family N-acetyltransferase n=1 Tax=Plantactinospora sp. GCM10030261 TaxID=3273420 RepID=UPI00360CFB40